MPWCLLIVATVRHVGVGFRDRGVEEFPGRFRVVWH